MLAHVERTAHIICMARHALPAGDEPVRQRLNVRREVGMLTKGEPHRLLGPFDRSGKEIRPGAGPVSRHERGARSVEDLGRTVVDVAVDEFR
jgi:hypothetical protein